MANRSQSSGFSLQPIDRTALAFTVLLTALIAVLLLSGSHAVPRVRDFSWQDRQVSSSDRAFLLSFNRPMNRDSVEQNLEIAPPLAGKFSWAGRRMAYTLNEPAPYGTEFVIQLKGARDRFTEVGERGSMPLFEGKFRTRDRAFVYLGVEGEEMGRLVLNNLTRQEQTILTPANLVVMDYKPYPEGDRILFSASDRQSVDQALLDQKLYTVTTGIEVGEPPQSPLEPNRRRRSREAQPGGIVEQVLDSDDYQNLKFELSNDGETIVVQRVERNNPAEFGLWMLQEGEQPRPIETEPGGDFLIAPDSTTLAMAQGQGMAILPLEDKAEPLDFLPRFGTVLSFAPDGSAAAMVRFNEEPQNPTRSLFLVTNQGTEQELLETNGAFLSAQFDATRSLLYVLVTERLPVQEYIEQPYLVAVNLRSTSQPPLAKTLLKLPIQRDIQMSLAPDGLGILFDQAVPAETDLANPTETPIIIGTDGRAIATSRLWVLPLTKDADGNPTPNTPQQLPLAGIRPRWLP
ncbi:hypothetical protein ACQ4M4_00910 [Leptolyngbya sp. AN02str]|uniref:hypothetical protein n=1 Tax=Leptolyngbya sp. AN02str TaxID=3423363 RepID=UPI003D3197F9